MGYVGVAYRGVGRSSVDPSLFSYFYIFFIVRSFGKNAAAKFFSYPMKKIFFFLKKIFLNFGEEGVILQGTWDGAYFVRLKTKNKNYFI